MVTTNLQQKELGHIIQSIDEYSEGLNILIEILKVRDWFCAYYFGYNKKNLIRLLTGSRLEHLNVNARANPTAPEIDDPRLSKHEDWTQKIHYWKTGGMLDSEIVITDYPWQRDGELKETLRESIPQIVFLLGEAATQTEQKRYSWHKGKDFIVGQVKSIYAPNANTGERFRLLLED
ncbi:MAG: hypothetical protein AAF984_10525 [Verrucomicrobiota bacterium]